MVKLLHVNEVNELIDRGAILSIAADEAILKKLKPGSWIAGSIPYFMSPEGGVFTKDFALVTDFTATVKNVKIVEYAAEELAKIPQDYYANGFSIIILPALSPVHSDFSKNSFTYPGILSGNLVGWVSGNDLSISNQRPLVYNGKSGHGALYNKAVVLHAELPSKHFARTEIVNIFAEDEKADVIEFFESTYEVSDCLINGKPQKFSDYLTANKVDPRFPMIADYSGAKINVSFKDVMADRVSFYAPVFPLVKYRLAKPITNYESAFNQHLQKMEGIQPIFSCNCILNYLFAKLEGKTCGAIGPMTFGEIAYILLNQTLVYLFIEEA